MDGTYFASLISSAVQNGMQGIMPAAKEIDINRDDIILAKINFTLRQLGCPAHLLGFGFVREAIYTVVSNPGVMRSVTKVLYPSVAKRFDTTPQSVERAIRHAISVSWDRGSEEEINRLFGHTISCERGKPTNSEFIATIADEISASCGQH